MDAAHPPQDIRSASAPIHAGLPGSTSLEELFRLYDAERAARIAAEKRLEAAVRERDSAVRSAEVRDYVMASAHCLLWYAEILETGAQYLSWNMEFPNIDAARRFLPIEVRDGEKLQDAWYLRRHPDDRTTCDRIGTESVRAGKSYQQEFRCHCEDGTIRWLHEDVRVETVIDGRHWRAVGVCTDITAHHYAQARMLATNRRLKRSIAETHHRVKNNLQVVAALVEMQQNEEAQPPQARTAFRRMAQHIGALAAMHDLLTYEARAGSDVESVSIRAVLDRLVGLVRQTLAGRDIRTEVEDIRLPARHVTSLVILVNELLGNAVKHAEGAITLTLQVRSGFVQLEVSDEGPGFPAGFDPLASGRTGLEIVESIGRLDLQGTLAYETRPEGGGRIRLEFLPGNAEGT